MSWGLVFMIFFLAFAIIFLFYCAFMEIIAESHQKQFKLKDLLNGPGMYVEHIRKFYKEKK